MDLPGGASFAANGTQIATSNTWWRLPATGTLVEYNGSVTNDSVTSVSSYYFLKEYYYQYAWTIPTNNNGTCGIRFEVAPPSLTNWIDAILPDNADGTNVTDGLTIQRQIGQ